MSNSAKAPALPPDSRKYLTYDEAASWWSEHLYSISARSLRRFKLKTVLIGRNRLILFSDLKELAALEAERSIVAFQEKPRAEGGRFSKVPENSPRRAPDSTQTP